jgi:hypothetical protein
VLQESKSSLSKRKAAIEMGLAASLAFSETQPNHTLFTLSFGGSSPLERLAQP